ncbi:2-C-methyl-D-erythritol 2,4-cyclodiphosphate synthase [Polystyrenella longa]|uniref:2-C-methyl-D-erythritol 2,4-cyclodiphosphate synthase n=1 Tax=Polystyrenella longa TaxID=2528007 RepID=A0A518CK15_9PLAN|nr:2-C-methyl-D-erythritol 2,4-cyclodiphosphate synthase [Polystyrenella longa]QDU79560.1 2-C-methyl-D-erythritol 2,4-cyclodiphosphate synthase [Polystyrenella longa]
MSFRVGLGTDVHRLDTGLPLILGGIPIEHTHGLVGHSDADIVLHAITDALLGAVGLGDIGEWFPDTDPEWKGADSSKFVEAAVSELANQGWQVVNLDCIIHAQAPKLLPYKAEIRANLARLLRVEESQINVKAKTGEKVGPVGERQAMEATVVVLVQQADS